MADKMLPFVTVPDITPAEAGCWLDGHMGWHNHYRVVDLAFDYGWSPDDRDVIVAIRDAYAADPYRDTAEVITGPLIPETVHLGEAVFGQGGLVDDATDYLQSLAPEGYWFEWDMGELCLVAIEDGTGGPPNTAFCRHCDEIIYQDSLGTWIDEATGGDVCGWDGGNEPHQPDVRQPED